METKSNGKESNIQTVSLIGVGIALGAGAGLVLDNLALGIGIGIIFGIVLSAGLRQRRKGSDDNE